MQQLEPSAQIKKCSKRFFYSLSPILTACVREIWWARAHKVVRCDRAWMIPFPISRQGASVEVAGRKSSSTHEKGVHPEFRNAVASRGLLKASECLYSVVSDATLYKSACGFPVARNLGQKYAESVGQEPSGAQIREARGMFTGAHSQRRRRPGETPLWGSADRRREAWLTLCGYLR